jgi:hypothetical protein
MEKICAFGSKIIVEKEQTKKSEGFITVEDDSYERGKVVSMGSVIPCDLLSDSDVCLEPGSLIAYPASKASVLGLGFPDTYYVVEAEDVVGVIYQEKEHGE